MIHLALTIAAALFLFWVFAVGLAILAHTWKWVLGLLVVIILLLYAGMRERPTNLQATQAPSVASSSKRPSLTLPERLRVDPPVIATLPHGAAWFVSAIQDPDYLRLIVNFSSDNATPMLESDVANSLPLLRESLCGVEGVVAQYALTSTRILIIAYEDNKRVGQVEIPKEYCPKTGG